jgi:primosomal protein N'
MGRIKIPDFRYAEAGFSFYIKALTRSNAVNPAGLVLIESPHQEQRS